MPETARDIIGKVYRELRIRSDAKLPYLVVLDQLNDTARGYAADCRLAQSNDDQTQEKNVRAMPKVIDFTLPVDGETVYEPRRVAYSGDDGSTFRAIEIVSYDAFAQHSAESQTICCFYGAASEDGLLVKFNQSRDWVLEQTFRLGYRLPMFDLLRLSDAPNLPADFYPMLAKEVAFHSARKVYDDSPTWTLWKRENLPFLKSEIEDWRVRWQRHLQTNLEPMIVSQPAFNDYRRRNGRSRLRTGEIE